MKEVNTHYLSGRGFVLFGVFSAFALFLISLLTVIVFSERRYFIPLLLSVFLFIAILYGAYLWLYKPYRETNKVLKLFAEGYLMEGIFDVRMPFSREMELANHKFREMWNTTDLINISKKQAEYLALQNQINPHFLYNTLEGIRSEALLAGMEGVAEMTEALATFFRYTITHVENLVMLEDELANIENYYIIQQYRFGKRLNLSIEFIHGDEEDEMDILKCRLPKLTLQPIVENSIFHGIERKIGNGTLRIKIQTSSVRLMIIISDDGLGMEEEKLRELNYKLRTMTLDDVYPDTGKKGGIAIANVNNRIKLLFGEEYGIHIRSTVNVGTDVEITLPLMRDQESL